MNTKRIVQIITFALTLAATLAIFALPSYLQVSTNSNGNETTSTVSVLTVVGPWFLAVLAISNIIGVTTAIG